MTGHKPFLELVMTTKLKNLKPNVSQQDVQHWKPEYSAKGYTEIIFDDWEITNTKDHIEKAITKRDLVWQSIVDNLIAMLIEVDIGVEEILHADIEKGQEN